MRYVFIIILLIVNISAYCQSYFSRIITTDANPLLEELLFEDGIYYISVDFFDNDSVKGGVIQVLPDSDIKYKYDMMNLGLNPISTNGADKFLVGKNPLNKENPNFFIAKMTQNFNEIKWYQEYAVKMTQRTVNSAMNYLDDHLYVLNVNTLSDTSIEPKRLNIFKFDTTGNNVWDKIYNEDKRLCYAYQLINSYDNNLIVSGGVVYYDRQGRYSQLYKIDQQGNILWNNEGNEDHDNGTIPTWAAQLSDSTIVQTYYIDRRSDMEFIANNWFELPIRLKWYSKDGDSIAEKLIITPKKEYITYNGLKKGNGNYFFAYGQYEDSNPIINDIYYSHLIKLSNRGDTIWVRNYQHPEFEEPRVTHSINDIFEHENGDISILATIRRTAEKNEIWLYKVNSDGCYINDECEDMTDLVSTEEAQDISQPLLFPNPALDVLYITFIEGQFSRIEIKDQLGNTHILFQSPIDSNVEIDISQLLTGVYYVILHLNNGEKRVKRFVKL